jgi:Mlc titration factor MtfA (ptsG expression regulator)
VGVFASLLSPLLFFVALAMAAAAWLVGPPLLRALRRERIRRQPFPAAWRDVLRRRMPAFARLPADLQLQLKKHVQVLLAEKPFIGCAGLVVTTEMRVLIAAQAALLLLNRRADYFANLRQILVYPGAFVVNRSTPDANGLTHDTRRTLSGESWQQGQVLLSWDDVLAGAADPDDGHNVVIHEFAHQLDQERGRANGAPWLGRREAGPAQGRPKADPAPSGGGERSELGGQYIRWAAVLTAEFRALQQRLARGEPGVIDPYGATDPAEFFAVVSEHFFEQPGLLAAAHPALYGQLVQCYRTDPLSW